MKWNIELNESDIEDLLELYKKVIVLIKGNNKSMESIYELNCERCGADYQLSYIESVTADDQPIHCPFCGGEVDLSDVEEESLDTQHDLFDELDFDDD